MMSASTSAVDMMDLLAAADLSVATEPCVGCCVQGVGVLEIDVVELDSGCSDWGVLHSLYSTQPVRIRGRQNCFNFLLLLPGGHGCKAARLDCKSWNCGEIKAGAAE